jgi:hypothetical protein
MLRCGMAVSAVRHGQAIVFIQFYGARLACGVCMALRILTARRLHGACLVALHGVAAFFDVARIFLLRGVIVGLLWGK